MSARQRRAVGVTSNAVDALAALRAAKSGEGKRIDQFQQDDVCRFCAFVLR